MRLINDVAVLAQERREGGTFAEEEKDLGLLDKFLVSCEQHRVDLVVAIYIFVATCPEVGHNFHLILLLVFLVLHINLVELY